MSAIQNFAFEEHLVRVIDRNGEAWFLAGDVCKALDLAGAPSQHLRRVPDAEKGVIKHHTLGGEQDVTILSEPGVYRLTFRSNKSSAQRFQDFVFHEVLPQIRRTGKFDPAAAPAEPLPSDQRMALALITEARMLYGRARARLLWESLPVLPQVPPLPPVESGDERNGFACLAHMLAVCPDDGSSVADHLAEAFEENGEALRVLRDLGLRVVTDESLGAGLVVATAAASAGRLFRGTRWAAGNHAAALRALPGAVRYKTMKFGANRASSSIFLPAHLLAGTG